MKQGWLRLGMSSRNVAAGASSMAGLPVWRKEAWCLHLTLPVRGRGRVRRLLRDRCRPRDSSRRGSRCRGRRLVDRALPNGEPELVALFAQLQARGRVLVVVDQLASIGALAVAVARSRGVTDAYLPGLSMRRIADL